MSAQFCPACRFPVDIAAPACAKCGFDRPGSKWPTDPYIGRVIDGKYALECRLGAGGMGAVFRATQMHGQAELGDVVLKFLLAEVASNPSVRNRFVNEAKAARQISSPHVVKVFDMGFDDDGAPFMVMEYLEGTSLAEVLEREGRLKPRRAVLIAMQVAEAMEECHAKSILHRDLKPNNIQLQAKRNGDFVKILDFGIARVPRPDGGITSTLMGTPRYMPPEQLLMQEVDAGVDIYALGVILFEMLAGEPPIVGKTPYEYVQLNINAPPRKLSDVVPGMSASLVDLVDRMLAKDRTKRPPSMAHVFAELTDIARDSGWIEASAEHSGALTRVDPKLPDTEPKVPDTEAVVSALFGRRRGALFAYGAAVIVVVALGAVGLSRVLRVGEDRPSPTTAALSGEARRPTTEPNQQVSPPPGTTIQPTSAPPPAPPPTPPAMIRLQLRSDPLGAAVFEAGRAAPHGLTPLEIEVPAGERPLTLTFRKRGYRPTVAQVVPREGGSASVTLKPAKPPPTTDTSKKPEEDDIVQRL